LFRAYVGAEWVVTYSPDVSLADQIDAFPLAAPPVVVVHSCGFFALMAARGAGRLHGMRKLVVIDGWFPHDHLWAGAGADDGACVKVQVPLDVACVFFFPTFGDRSDYPLEAVVRQAMVERADVTVVRGVGFGHNLLYPPFGLVGVRALVDRLVAMPDRRGTDADVVVTF
jgi:hypothetical protein